jgi:hypothetical protein
MVAEPGSFPGRFGMALRWWRGVMGVFFGCGRARLGQTTVHTRPPETAELLDRLGPPGPPGPLWTRLDHVGPHHPGCLDGSWSALNCSGRRTPLCHYSYGKGGGGDV